MNPNWEANEDESEPPERKPTPSGSGYQRTVVPTDTSKASVEFDPVFGINLRQRKLAKTVYLPVEEVENIIGECHHKDDRRGITAILRIMEEQITVRQPLSASKRGFNGLMALALILMVYGAFARVRSAFFIPAGISVVLALVNVVQIRRLLPLEAAYRSERSAIQHAAADAISKLVRHKRFPKRLYVDDLKGLDRLARDFDWFVPFRDSLVAACG